jgi:hypothetical protein
MSHIMSWPRGHVAWQWSLLAVRAATAAGLAIDAYVHLDLAGLYAEAGGTINEGVLFRVQAAVALLAACAVIAIGHRACGRGQRACRDAGLAVRGPRGTRPLPRPVRPRLVPREAARGLRRGRGVRHGAGRSRHHRPGRKGPPTKTNTAPTAQR